MPKPSKKDYAEYYHNYVQQIDTDDIIGVLENQLNKTLELFKNIPEEKGNHSYSEGKWTVKEVLGHLVDTERILAYRALSFARNERQELPGFEQDDYVAEGFFNDRTINNLLEEFTALRKANIVMFKNFSDDILMRRGNANNSEFTVNAFQYIIPGHVEHHLKILKEKYI